MKHRKKNPLHLFSAFFLLLIFFGALAAPLICKYSYDEQNIEERLEPPSAKHYFGTDSLGRDLYSRVLYGARVSLAVGIITAALSLVIGIIYGCIAGYLGGWVDQILMRLLDAIYIFPNLLFAILIMVLFNERQTSSLLSGLMGIIIALSFSSWANTARLVRSEVLLIDQLLHVEAARGIGQSTFHIIRKHILPLLMGPLLINLTFQIPNSILTESFMSFIGVGLQPPFSSWGALANEGWRAIRSFPHLILFPGTILFITLLSFQLLGEALRDLLDPKKD